LLFPLLLMGAVQYDGEMAAQAEEAAASGQVLHMCFHHAGHAAATAATPPLPPQTADPLLI
jgi:hypothetical protein